MKEKTLKPSSSPKGLIVFCERNLRYEGGLKAWLTLGPVLLGAWLLEAAITSHHGGPHRGILLWFIFLAYLIIFPPAWKSVLRFLRRKLVLDMDDHPSVPASSVPGQAPSGQINGHDERSTRAAA